MNAQIRPDCCTQVVLAAATTEHLQATLSHTSAADKPSMLTTALQITNIIPFSFLTKYFTQFIFLFKSEKACIFKKTFLAFIIRPAIILIWQSEELE